MYLRIFRPRRRGTSPLLLPNEGEVVDENVDANCGGDDTVEDDNVIRLQRTIQLPTIHRRTFQRKNMPILQSTHTHHNTCSCNIRQ